MNWTEFLAGLVIGLLLASNIPSIAKFFSFWELLEGFNKGLSMGEKWKKGDKKKK